MLKIVKRRTDARGLSPDSSSGHSAIESHSVYIFHSVEGDHSVTSAAFRATQPKSFNLLNDGNKKRCRCTEEAT